MTKRIFDLVAAGFGLMVLAPVLVAAALSVRLDSSGPAFFRQERVGRNGKPFRILKFRTMVVGAANLGPVITVGRDPRVTRVGRFLRRTKLDELPQLINVLKGDMSLVGPRPEVAKYVALYPPGVRAKVLSVRPGITDEASILYADEAELLAVSVEPERFYAEQILPRKLSLYERYVDERTFMGDLLIIFRTLRRVLAG